jgi:hypothetical protein
MSTASKQYRFTSEVGKFNASALLAAHEAGEKVEEEKVLKRIAEESYARFHIKDGLYEDDGTSKNALGRVRRDLQRLKGNKWVIPTAKAEKPLATATSSGPAQKRKVLDKS